MSLIAELKRRNVFKVGTAYLALGWVILQVTATVVPYMHLPDWTVPFVLWVGAIGFPCALIFSWLYELTPEGLKRETEVDRAQSITGETSRKLDRLIVALLVLAIGLFVYGQLRGTPPVSTSDATTPPPPSVGAGHARDSTPAPGTEADRSQATTAQPAPGFAPDPKSIAVLPFVNMSSDKEQEYFSDGLSEELLNLLARIPELRVTSRSSAFAFKGKEVEIPEVARKLNVAHVLEGSVRKSGERVRITAQLIDTRSDTHLWSQTWDRTLEDIFAVQDEIAAAVAAQMKLTLLGEAPKARAVDPRAYALYLQAREMFRRNTAEGMSAALGLYQQALEIDPGYAAAMAGLANVYTGQVAVGLRPIAEGEALARETAEKALALDPDSADAELSLARIAMNNQRDFAAAARHLKRALELDPNKIDALALAATLTKNLGRFDTTMSLVQLALERDPVSSGLHNNVGLNYIAAGRLDEAIAEFRTALALSPGRIGTQYNIAEALLHKGEAAAALDVLQQESAEVWRLIGTAMAYHSLGRRADSDKALADLVGAGEASWSYNIAFVHAWRGEPDKAFEWLEKAVEYKDPGLAEIAGERLFRTLHDDPRWLPFLRRIGMAPEQLAAVPFDVSFPGQPH